MLVVARKPKAVRTGLSDVTVYCPDGTAIRISVLSSDPGTVRLGITAPKGTHPIYREEIDPHGRTEQTPGPGGRGEAERADRPAA
jgi:sRNA-binding carbon storage regulator CsrA